MYTSDSNILACVVALCAAVLMCCGCTGAAAIPPGAYGSYAVAPADAASETDARWADYLAGQIGRRSDGAALARGGAEGAGGCLSVAVRCDSALPRDFVVERSGSALTLAARDGGKMLWLIYQFLSSCSGGPVDVGDLPPACVSMDGDSGDFAFEYRGIYTPSNSDPGLMPVTASHNVDYDWALWGHNLGRVFGGRVPEGACAVVGGRRTPEQFCFSSGELFDALSAFVEASGGGEAARFAVMPNDNDLVCRCPMCLEAGNTAASATPAVSRLLRRLAMKYPGATFFTSAYRTTAGPPSGSLPPNTGVIVSAMGLPLSAGFASTPGARAFAAVVGAWRKAAGRVYVWDYIRNFDDYLTPFPCLRLVQARLGFYRSLGVGGVFLNGSSPHYAPFDDVQTATLCAMLVRPGISAMEYADSCFARFYPVAAPVLAPAYRSWEDTVVARRARLPLYGGIGEAVGAWLRPGAFAAFCDSLDRRSKLAAETERARLNRMLTATWFTRLELLRRPGGGYSRVEAARLLDGLGGYAAFPDMASYREADGSLAAYVAAWGELMAGNGAAAASRLRGLAVESVSPPDDGYADMGPLTDGLCALTTDYHEGWVVSSAPVVVWRLPAGSVGPGDRLELSFLCAPRWRIHPPRRLEVWQGGRRLAAGTVQGGGEPFSRARASLRLDGADGGAPVEVRMVQGGGVRPTLACDEVEVFTCER